MNPLGTVMLKKLINDVEKALIEAEQKKDLKISKISFIMDVQPEIKLVAVRCVTQYGGKEISGNDLGK